MNKKSIGLFLTTAILIFILIFFLIRSSKPKIECGNGLYQSWSDRIIDSPTYFYDSKNNLIATCPSEGDMPAECINLVKQCREYQKINKK